MTNHLIPKVSVVLPVYQTPETYLRETIESILAQTYTNFEFLILDDCPEKSVESIVKSYSDKRIRYYKNTQNLGIASSRNKLIDLSQGEYLAVIDHDDIDDDTDYKRTVKGWEKQFYKSKINFFQPYLYNSYIDTTFTLYKP